MNIIRKNLFITIFIIISLITVNNLKASKYSIIDDILEVFAKKTAKITDNSKIFKRIESLKKIIKKNPDLLIGMKKIDYDDMVSTLKKLKIEEGSELAKQFRKLSHADKLITLNLQEITEKILKRSDGLETLKRFDKDGLLICTKFGDEIIDPLEKIIKSDNIWKASDEIADTLKKLSPEKVNSFKDLLKNKNIKINAKEFLNTSKFTSSYIVERSLPIIRKYGKRGFVNIKKVLKTAGKTAKEHKILTAAVVCLAFPDLILTPLGMLKDGYMKILDNTTEIITETIVGTAKVPIIITTEIPKKIAKAIIKAIGLDPEKGLGKFIYSMFYPILIILFILLILLIFKSTRFIPKKIFSIFKKKNKKNSEGK